MPMKLEVGQYTNHKFNSGVNMAAIQQMAPVGLATFIGNGKMQVAALF